MPSIQLTSLESEDTVGGLTYNRGFLSGYPSGDNVNICRFKNITNFGYHATISAATLTLQAWRDDTAASAQCIVRVGLEPAWKFIDLRQYTADYEFNYIWVRNNMGRSSNYATWNLPNFVQGTDYTSPGFASALQEMVNSKWFRGGDIFIILEMTGSGVRTNVEGDFLGMDPADMPRLNITYTEDATYVDAGFLSLNARSKVTINYPQDISLDVDARSKLEFIIQQAAQQNIDAAGRSKVDFEIQNEIDKQLAINIMSKVEFILEGDLEKELLANVRAKVEFILGKLIVPEDLELKARSSLQMIIGKQIEMGGVFNMMSKVEFDLFNWTEWLKKNKDRAIPRYTLLLMTELGIVGAEIPIRNFELYYTGSGTSFLSVMVPWGYLDEVRQYNALIEVQLYYEVEGEISTRVPICRAIVSNIDTDELRFIQLICKFDFPAAGRSSSLYYSDHAGITEQDDQFVHRVGIPDVDPFMRPADRIHIPGIGTEVIESITYVFGPDYYSTAIDLVV